MSAPRASPAPAVRLADLSHPAERARIEDFVRDNGGSVFQRPAWLLGVERGTGNRAFGLVAERGGALVGWLGLTHLRSPFFGHAMVASGFGIGGGVLGTHPDALEALCGAARELCERRGASGVELRGGAAAPDWSATTGHHAGFAGPLATSDEAQLMAIPRKARAEVRKGLANDLAITTGRGEAERAAHHAVYAASVHNLGTPVFPRSLFDAMLDSLGDAAEIMVVSHCGKPVSSVLSFYHQGAVLPYWGGGVAEARALHSTERMYYELMCRARRQGCERFDFGRSRTGTGPYRFKKNWGFVPEPLTYHHWTAPGCAPRQVDPGDTARMRQAALWRHLPPAIANRLGPIIARGLG